MGWSDAYGQLRGHPGLRMRRLSQGMNAFRWDSVKGAWATTTLREPAPKGLTAGKIRQPSRGWATTLSGGQRGGAVVHRAPR